MFLSKVQRFIYTSGFELVVFFCFFYCFFFDKCITPQCIFFFACKEVEVPRSLSLPTLYCSPPPQKKNNPNGNPPLKTMSASPVVSHQESRRKMVPGIPPAKNEVHPKGQKKATCSPGWGCFYTQVKSRRWNGKNKASRGYMKSNSILIYHKEFLNFLFFKK